MDIKKAIHDYLVLNGQYGINYNTVVNDIIKTTNSTQEEIKKTIYEMFAEGTLSNIKGTRCFCLCLPLKRKGELKSEKEKT
jgi:hypothetical protein